MSATASPGALRPLLHALRENGRLLAALAQRLEVGALEPPAARRTIHGPADVAAYLGPELADLAQEQLRVLLLDTKNRVLGTALVYQGGANQTVVRLADCFREAVRLSATALLFAHNHPSGTPDVSPEDVRLTREAALVGELLGVPVLDHVIVAREGFASLRAQGLYTPDGATTASAVRERTADYPRPRRRWGDGVLGWAYDCPACRLHVRGLADPRLSCQRCLAPVTCRALDAAREQALDAAA